MKYCFWSTAIFKSCSWPADYQLLADFRSATTNSCVILGKLSSSLKKHPLHFTLAFIVNQNYIGLLVTCISLLIGSLHYSFWRCNIIFLRGKWDLSELIQMVVKSKPGKLDFFCFIRKV